MSTVKGPLTRLTVTVAHMNYRLGTAPTQWQSIIRVILRADKDALSTIQPLLSRGNTGILPTILRIYGDDGK